MPRAPNRRQQPLGAVGDEHVPPRYRDPVAAAQAARPAREYLAVDEQPDTADILDAHRAVGSTRDHGVAVCGARGIDPQPGAGGAADHHTHVREPVPRALEEDRRSQGDVDALATALEGDLLPRGCRALSG